MSSKDLVQTGLRLVYWPLLSAWLTASIAQKVTESHIRVIDILKSQVAMLHCFDSKSNIVTSCITENLQKIACCSLLYCSDFFATLNGRKSYEKVSSSVSHCICA